MQEDNIYWFIICQALNTEIMFLKCTITIYNFCPSKNLESLENEYFNYSG